MTIAEFRGARCMAFVKKGMRVKSTYSNRGGRIAGVNSSMNLNIIFDGERHSENCHPHFMMQYFDETGKLIKEYTD